MFIIGVVVIMYSLVLGYKKPHYTISLFALIVSFSPFFSVHLSMYIYYATLFLIVILLFINVINNNMLNVLSVILISFSLMFLLIQVLYQEITSTQIVLYILRYIIIPFVAYYSHRFLNLNRIALSKIFYPYFVINLCIFYIRSFVDYSFFGTFKSYFGTVYESLYTLGGANYRPSNLNSPIVFAVEIACFLMLLYIENASISEKRFFTLFSVLPLILMRSRSSYILLLVFALALAVFKNKKKYIKLIGTSTITGIVLFFSNIGKQMLDIFTFSDHSYMVRTSSISNSLSFFSSQDIITILLGFGPGYSNYELIPGEGFNIYVENFHMSILYDMGAIIFAAWVIFNFILILISFKTSTKKMALYMVVVGGMLIVNIFSSNLTAYTIQILYWIIIFRIISMIEVKSEAVAGKTSFGY